MTLKPRHVLWAVALAAATVVVGCSDDSSDDGASSGSGASSGTGGKNGSGGKDSASGGKKSSGGEGLGGEPSTGGTGGEDGSGGTGGGTNGPACRSLPSVLSLKGCTGIGPLCTVKNEAVEEGECPSTFEANCGGTLYEGQIDATSGDFTFTGVTPSGQSTLETTCAGKVQRSGRVDAECSQTPAGGEAAACELVVDPVILPGVTCIELPRTFDDLSLVEQDPSGTPARVDLGTCTVVQDGCAFQAECDSDVVIKGTATKTGVSFSRMLTALKDAATADPTTGNPNPVPAFVAGATVNHSCTAAVEGNELAGTCSAGGVGGGRGAAGKPATSVYALTSDLLDGPGECELLAPDAEHLFVLDSCELLKHGEDGIPGIGEPVCAFRQNNCIWEVQCGSALRFEGRLQPGATQASWRLETGTPCEGGFDEQGNFAGKCTVPGQDACVLSSKAPAPADPSECAQLPAEGSISSHGCGGVTISCRDRLQHGCDFLAICDFGASRFPDMIFTGEASKRAGRDQMSFNGAAGYTCEVQKVTESDIGTAVGATQSVRVEDEWYGQCTIEDEEGNVSQCNQNANFHGFRLFFGDRACGISGQPACVAAN